MSIENNPNITQDLLARLAALPIGNQPPAGQPPMGAPTSPPSAPVNPTPTNTAAVPAAPQPGVQASPSNTVPGLL